MGGLTFVNLGLLAGAITVAVPIVLHLVMRQQPRQLEFPALRFIRMREHSNSRRMKLRHWLLLLLRAAALCLLALALARPSIQGTALPGGEQAPVAAAFVIDTSPRMDYLHQNQTRLEAAGQMASWLLTQLPRESEVAIVDSATVVPAFSVDLGAAEQRVERLNMTAIARPLPTMIESALTLLKESEKERREIYVFTDLTRHAWGKQAAQRLARRKADLENVGIYIIDVGVKQPQNFALGRPRLSSALLARYSPLEITIELSRSGPDDQRSVELVMLDERGEPQKRGQQAAQWISGQRSQLVFQLRGLDTGTHQGMLRIAGQDALKWDNERYFTIDVREAWRVLVVAATPEHAIYFTEALAPASFRKSGQARFVCDVIPQSDLGKHRLGDYRAVCLLDPRAMPEATWARLGDYVAGGGRMALLLGRNAELASFNSESAQRLLPSKLKRRSRDATYLAPRDLNHPMLAKFRDLEAVPWQSFDVFQHWQHEALPESAAVVIPYADGSAALIEASVGQGRVLTMTTPLSDPANVRGREPWNMLPTGFEPWPFVMLTNEMMLYLVGSQEERLNFVAGETAVLHLNTSEPPPMALLITPRGDRIRKTIDAKQKTIVFSSTDQPGHYRATAGGQGGLNRGFSVNLAAELSDLVRLEPTEIEAIFTDIPYRVARSRKDIHRDLDAGRVGQELFPFLILLVALVLGFEHVLANRFYRQEK